jgi:hypothetical protein
MGRPAANARSSLHSELQTRIRARKHAPNKAPENHHYSSSVRWATEGSVARVDIIAFFVLGLSIESFVRPSLCRLIFVPSLQLTAHSYHRPTQSTIITSEGTIYHEDLVMFANVLRCSCCHTLNIITNGYTTTITAWLSTLQQTPG